MIITQLKPNQVFVFGSNLQGFHGAGAAGYASFGEHGNVWRKHNYAQKPSGWKGEWNQKGVASGPQEGTHGKSYAIPTVTRPGAKRSIPLTDIRNSVKNLMAYAASMPHLEFLVVYTGNSHNLNGYTAQEMASTFAFPDIPQNILFEEHFLKLINESKN